MTGTGRGLLTLFLCAFCIAACSNIEPPSERLSSGETSIERRSPTPSVSPALLTVSSGATTAIASPTQPVTLSVDDVPFDVGAVMRQVRFAYRERTDVEGWRGGYGTYEVEIQDHQIEVTPIGARGVSGELIEGAPLLLETVSVTRDDVELLGVDSIDFLLSLMARSSPSPPSG